MREVAVLGATGSIGTSALDLVARHPGMLRARTLVAGRRVDALVELCRIHHPAHAAVAHADAYGALRDGLRAAGLSTQAHAGTEAICALAAEDGCDTVVAAIVGAAGLDSTSPPHARQALLLANRCGVMAGELLMQAAPWRACSCRWTASTTPSSSACPTPRRAEARPRQQCSGSCHGVRRTVAAARAELAA